MIFKDSIELVSLAGSLQPVIDHFNRHKNNLRFLALLSPTWPGWSLRGTRAVQKSIIDEFPNTQMNVTIVWINMLPNDSDVTAKDSAINLSDKSIQHFYDPDKLSGKAIAESVGWKDKVAWDIYLFYVAGAEWIEDPPIPDAWMHQLSENWADREHFRTGEYLAEELYSTVKALLETGCLK